MAKICTWNVNGIRQRDNLAKVFSTLNADVFCIQETRVSKDQIKESLAFINDYTSCFSIPTKLVNFKGRSGCVTYYLDSARPFHADYGFLNDSTDSEEWKKVLLSNDLNLGPEQIKDLDSEGRLVITSHNVRISRNSINDEEDDGMRKLHIFNVYFPHLIDQTRYDRAIFKQRFNQLFEQKVKYMLEDPKSHVVVACDINIRHKQIDTFEEEKDFDEDIHRKWLTRLVSPSKSNNQRYMIDSFRKLYPTQQYAYTCWPTYYNPTRVSNLGHRIDLILTDNELANYIKDVTQHTEIMGSDHCPVMIEFCNIEFVTSKNHPPGSSRLWPDFRKRQTSLRSFFKSSSKRRDRDNMTNSDIGDTDDPGEVKPTKKMKTEP